MIAVSSLDLLAFPLLIVCAVVGAVTLYLLATASANTAAARHPNSTKTQFWVCRPAKM